MARLADLALTAFTLGSLMMFLLRYTWRYRHRIPRQAPFSVTALFVACLVCLELAGEVSDIGRLHEPLTFYLPLHFMGTLCLLGAIILSRRVYHARIR